MAKSDDTFEEQVPGSSVRAVVVPLVALVAFVVIVSGLVLGGVIQGHEPRTTPEHAPTTRPTIEIAP